MENLRKYLPLALRIIVSFLFLLSAVAKLYPSPYFAVSTFEVKQLYPMGFNEEFAKYFSRTLIGIEFALGFLLLQRHYLKRFVVPATALLLIVFIGHLTIDTIQNGGNSGNCGCFGSLIEMTPIEAIIKNVVALLMLIYLYVLLPKEYDRRNFWVITTVTLASILMVFMLAPIQPTVQQPVIENIEEIPAEGTALPAATVSDSVSTTIPEAPVTGPASTEATTAAVAEPAPKRSAYTQYFTNVDKGKKIVAMFVPGCDHCREVAKELTEMKAKDKNFPTVQIIFMDEEAEKIPEFFEHAGAKYPYKIIDVISFWNLLGNDKDTPGVIYLWNGNKIREWDGINDRKFVKADFLKTINQPYTGK